MKQLALVGSLLCLAIGAHQSSLPPVVQGHADKLKQAQALKIEYTVQVLGGASNQYSLSFAKPNLIKVSSDSGFTLSDGKAIYTYDSRSKSYSEVPYSPEAANALLTKPEVWGWASFFNEKAFENVASAKAGATRPIKGEPSVEVATTFKEAAMPPITMYIDQKLGIARSYRMPTKDGELIVMASKITLGSEMDATEFTFVAPAGAAKVDPDAAPAAPSYAEIQKLLNQNCMPCHSMQRNTAGLQFTNHEGTMTAVTAGKPAASLLVKSLRGVGAAKMPKNRAPLSEAQIKLVEAWIAAGAKP